MDDIIVYSCGQTMESAIQDHDCNLTAVVQKARKVGLKLNKDKFKLRQTEFKYMGNILTAKASVLIQTKWKLLQIWEYQRM